MSPNHGSRHRSHRARRRVLPATRRTGSRKWCTRTGSQARPPLRRQPRCHAPSKERRSSPSSSAHHRRQRRRSTCRFRTDQEDKEASAPRVGCRATCQAQAYPNSYTIFCQEQRPLLPRGLLNSQREWTLGQMWRSLPDEERAKYKPEDGTVRKAARCNVGLTPSHSPAPAPAGAPSGAPPLAARDAAGAPPAVLPAAPSAAPPTPSAAHPPMRPSHWHPPSCS
jgi:hypothetical protein